MVDAIRGLFGMLDKTICMQKPAKKPCRDPARFQYQNIRRADSIEIGDMPEVALAAGDDFSDSIMRLREYCEMVAENA